VTLNVPISAYDFNAGALYSKRDIKSAQEITIAATQQVQLRSIRRQRSFRRNDFSRVNSEDYRWREGLVYMERIEQLSSELKSVMQRRGFDLKHVLGSGAFGTVYCATQKSLERTVAIKVFDKVLTQTEANIQHFQREALLLSRLAHPNIPYVLTSGKAKVGDKDLPYMVLQHIEGETLHALRMKQSNGRLDTARAVSIVSQVLLALDSAHQEKIIHRDMAPENILVNETAAYLIDFSIGFSLNEALGLQRPTLTNDKVGRHDYASPEQVRDSRSVTHLTDIYSTGIVLFEMLSGHPRMNPLTLDTDLAHVSTELRNVLRAACAKEPNERYQSAKAFLEALRPPAGQSWSFANEPKNAICRNLKCRKAARSNYGYLRGPRIVESCLDEYCNSCGERLYKQCSKCRHSLPEDLRQALVVGGKNSDALEAHCGRCGQLIFRTPTCQSCGSLLRDQDMGSDTEKNGCTKCRSKRKIDDDDIPF